MKSNSFILFVFSFFPLWKIISERWSKQLDVPLHYAGYFLNPQLHYTPLFRAHVEVKRGLSHCMTRMVVDPEERAKITIQIDDFDKREKLLGHPLARLTADKKIPSYWWEFYGDEHPELQKFAIQVLSLKCSSSGGERNRGAFEMVRCLKCGIRIVKYILLAYHNPIIICLGSHKEKKPFETKDNK